MQLPTLHLNGSSRDNLKLPLYAAVNHIYDAIRELNGEGEPNARDYYPQGPDAYALAQQQHTDRLLKLKSVRAELCILIAHIEDSK